MASAGWFGPYWGQDRQADSRLLGTSRCGGEPHLSRPPGGFAVQGPLLDVRCGPGALTRLLGPLFVNTVGIDVDAGMIALHLDDAAVLRPIHASLPSQQSNPYRRTKLIGSS
jgi:hypothetical protein